MNNINKGIESPLQTNLQYLPFEKLPWETFEQLCLALVQLDFSINDCERYGIQGENQQGIDIFARHRSGLYSVYQCKKYDTFTKTDLDKVIKKFEEGNYLENSKCFYICTACELNSIHVQDAFEKHKTILKSKNIDLIKWDKIQLSRILKNHPQIVFDYFNKEYVKAFNGEDALSSVFHLSDNTINSYLESASSELYLINNNFHIPDSHIKRKETQELYEWIKRDLKNKETNIAVLAGNAGTGKTVILKDLLNILNDDKVPVLGLKADKKHIKYEEVGKSVLDTDINVTKVFRQLLLKNKVVVLLVDQIDALSQSLSTNRSQIKAYTSLVSQLSMINGVRIVISCRIFDLHYDADLKQYTDKTVIELKPLLESEVETILKKLTGKSISYFPTELIELLKTPLHLEVFCRIYNESTIINEIKNLQDLYRNLWNQKIKEVKTKTDIEPSQLESVIFFISSQIYDRQDNLCIPSELLDSYYNEVKYLKTEGLITETNGSVQFFHQTFYDYCYARNFVEKQGGHLFNYLINLPHQGLFVRSSIRQVSSYLRLYNPKQYVNELKAILFSDKIRYHIKQLIIDQLSFENNPRQEEFRIIIELIENNPVLVSSFFYNIPNQNWHKFFIKENQTIISLINKKGTIIQEAATRFVVFSVNNDIESTYNILQKIEDENERLSLIDWTLIRTNDFTKPTVLDCYKIANESYIKTDWQRFHIFDKALMSNPDFVINEVKKVFNTNKNQWKSQITGLNNKEYHDFYDFCEKLYKEHPNKAYLLFKEIIKEFINISIVKYKFHVSILDEDYVFQNYQPESHSHEHHKLVKWIIDYLKKEITLNADFVKSEIISYLANNKATEIHIAFQVIAENISLFKNDIFSVLTNTELTDDFLEIDDLEYWYRIILEKIVYQIDEKQKKVLNNFILSYFTKKDLLSSKSFYDNRKKYGTYGSDKFYPYLFWGYNQRILLHSLPINYIKKYSPLKKRLQELDRRFSGEGWECKNDKPFHGVVMAHLCGPLLSDQKYKLLSIDQWHESFITYDKDIHYSKREYFDIEAHARAFRDTVKQDTKKYFDFISSIITSNNVNIRYQINGLQGLIEGEYNILNTRNLYSILMQYDISERNLYSFVRLSKHFINERVVDDELIEFLKKYIFLPLPSKSQSIFINKDDKDRNDILFSEGYRSINAAAFDALVELSKLEEQRNIVYDFLIDIHQTLPIQLRLVVLNEINRNTGFSEQQLLNLFIAYTFEVTPEIFHVAQELINKLFYHYFNKLIPFINQTIKMPEAAKSLGIFLLYGWFYGNEESKNLLLHLHQIQPQSIEHTIKEAFRYLNNSDLKDKCLFILNLYVKDNREFVREAYINNFYRLSPSDFTIVRYIIEEFINEQDEDDKLYNLYRYLIDCCNIHYLQCIDILRLINFSKSGKSRKEIEMPVKLLTFSYNAIKEYDSSNSYLEFAMDVFDNLLQHPKYDTNIDRILKNLDCS